MSAVVTLRTRRVYEGKILGLRVDTVQYGDAPSVEREIVEHPGSVVVVPLTDSGTVLFDETAAIGVILQPVTPPGAPRAATPSGGTATKTATAS